MQEQQVRINKPDNYGFIMIGPSYLASLLGPKHPEMSKQSLSGLKADASGHFPIRHQQQNTSSICYPALLFTIK